MSEVVDFFCFLRLSMILSVRHSNYMMAMSKKCMFLALVVFLGACAQSRDFQSPQSRDQIVAEVMAGDARLDCESACSGTWGSSRRLATRYLEEERWDQLIALVSGIGFRSNLTWYYLARSVEAKGALETSAKYYRISILPSMYQCRGVINNCDGHEFPRASVDRLGVVTAMLKSAQQPVISNAVRAPENISTPEPSVGAVSQSASSLSQDSKIVGSANSQPSEAASSTRPISNPIEQMKRQAPAIRSTNSSPTQAQPSSRATASQLPLADFDLARDKGLICKAAIATIMYRSEKGMRARISSNEVWTVDYVRESDGSKFLYRCRLQDQRVIWATDSGRWRDRSDDGALTYSTSGNRLTIFDQPRGSAANVRYFNKSDLQ